MGGTFLGKVLFIANTDNHLINFHLPFMKLLQGKGYEVYAAAAFTSREKEKCENLGVKWVHIPFSRSPFCLNNITAYRRLKALFKSIRFDLIHLQMCIRDSA